MKNLGLKVRKKGLTGKQEELGIPDPDYHMTNFRMLLGLSKPSYYAANQQVSPSTRACPCAFQTINM